jgi:hypothetical protein
VTLHRAPIARDHVSRDALEQSQEVPVIDRRDALTSDGPIVLLGDELDCLTVIRCHPSVMVASGVAGVAGRPRAAVISVDISAVAKRSNLRAELRTQMQLCVDICAQVPSVRRLILVIGGATPLPETTVYNMCTTAGDRIHSRIEQSCGLYTIVTLLLVSDCDDPTLLARRVYDRAMQPLGIDTAIVLNWEEIEHAPIGYTAANCYV